MTRPSSFGAGLRGSASEIFPDQAKETARARGMHDGSLSIGHLTETRTAGVANKDWVYDVPVRGRIDPLGAVGGSGRLSGDQVDSTSTHTATFDAPQRIKSTDRVLDIGSNTVFTVNARRFHSDEDVTQVEVRQLV